ncbi:MAG: sensor histidine kinase [Betaproteobacteria bacterium]|nr:sensor histidine kinase [Betaproteobacteria bacterium]
MADRYGSLFCINPSGRTLLGLESESDISGLALIECIAPSARPRITDEAIPSAKRSGAWSGNSVLLTSEGCEIDVSLVITAHFADDGRFDGLSLLACDMRSWTSIEEARRITRNELLRLSAQHLTIQETERRRIAADLHDGIGQSLSLVKLSIDKAAGLLMAGEPEKTAECLDRLKLKVEDVGEELRQIAMNLRPATLDALGIIDTLSWYFREFEAACPNVAIEREVRVSEADVPKCLKTPIFRIFQEASANAIKHAGANRIKVALTKRRGILELTIEDNGRGFESAAAAANDDSTLGLGLQTMRERAELCCGIFELKTAPGKGTRVRVRWPPFLENPGPDRTGSPSRLVRPISE